MTKHVTGTLGEWLAARLELLRREKELTRPVRGEWTASAALAGERSQRGEA